MNLEDITRNQAFTVSLIVLLLFGLLGLPILLQRLYNVSAVKVAFGVIVVYALINWHMQSQD